MPMTATTNGSATDTALPVLPAIPGYRVISELGNGGTATVYLAVQESLGRKVALKVSNQPSGDASAVERFLREAKIMSQLSHPYIVAVHEVGRAGVRHYIAMEYLGGGNLRHRIRSRDISVSDAVRIIAQITQALDFAHDKGFLHRDIKPGNILFRHDGSAVLTDFGIARATSPSSLRSALPASASTTVVGTPRYMSPEQAKGKALDRRSDLYAIGVLLFELLTGKVPFDGDDALDIGIKHLKARVPTLPPALTVYQAVVEKLLAKDPDQRYQRGQPFIEALYRVQASTSTKPTDESTDQLPHPPQRMRLTRLRLAVLIMLAMLLAVIAATQTNMQLSHTDDKRDAHRGATNA
jgi:serine/threonine-protein kinase PpkA